MIKRFGPCLIATTILLTGARAAGRAVARTPADASTKRNVELDWDPVDGATAYEVRVTKKEKDARPLIFRMARPHWSANVKPGPYVMELRAFDERGAPGAWSPPTDLEVKVPAPGGLVPADRSEVRARDDDNEDVTFRWSNVAAAVSYHVVIRTIVPAGEAPPAVIEKDATKPTVTVPLDVGREYAWTVVARDDAGRDGETATEAAPTFRLNGPRLRTPAPAAPLSKHADAVRWPAIPHADAYEAKLELLDRRTRAWTPVPGPTSVTTGEYPIDPRRPTGRYRLNVRAVAAHREASPFARVTFEANGGFADASALADARARDAIFRGSRLFGFANLQVGPAGYEYRSAEANSLVRFAAPGAHLQTGLIYQDRASAYAGDARATVSGLSVGGRTLRYASVEVLGTYRRSFGARGLLTGGAGVYYRQLPAILGGPTDGVNSLEAIGQPGLATGLVYARAVDDRWALRLEVRAYVPPTNPNLSTQVSGTTTYRMGRNVTLTGGLVRRADEFIQNARIGGSSFAAPGARNILKIESVNVTVGVEYGF